MFFENSECLRCHTPLGFDPTRMDIVAVGPGVVRCANADRAECNWLVPTGAPSDDAAPLCRCCELTRTRPSDDDPDGLAAFADTEAAKRRLVFQLLDLGLPVSPDGTAERPGIAFDLLSSRNQQVMIGHDAGLVTLDVAETDDARREQVRQQLGEPYRTMLGHLRHEIGHYYWPTLVGGDPTELGRFRTLFGDERTDYGAALDTHYAQGPPADWPDRHVSAYATMHPWEDWAETFAHYLHIRDTLQTAASFGMVVHGPDVVDEDDSFVSHPDLDVEDEPFGTVLADWLPLTYALNGVNRSMGRADLYPFVLAPTVIRKLAFVHRLLQAADTARTDTARTDPGGTDPGGTRG